MTQKVLVVNSELCVGCRVCELACSARHEHSFHPAKSRIHVIRWDGMGVDVPRVCLQCDKPPCMKVCPVEAFRRDEKTGAVLINYDVCIGCRLCVNECPFSGISVDQDRGMMIKCDLCGGDPQCVKYCPTKALQFVKADQVAWLKRRVGAEKIAKLTKQVVIMEGG